jgi:cytochrome c5
MKTPALLIALAASLLLVSCGDNHPPDEAKAAGKTAADFPPATTDVFAGMDAGVQLTPEEIEGRNTWMLWTGGNERFWNLMAQEGYGIIDLLKVIDSRERSSRFQRLGLVNEPGFASTAKPDQHGLYIDQPVSTPPDGIDPEIYGHSTGVLGLRLFPNPEFDEKAKARWNAEKFYTDVAYRTDPTLIRPYRVGMTCAICHVAPDPGNPPLDPENPTYENLSGTIGNQYFKNGKIFGFNLPKDDFLKQVMDAVHPGTVDTSIVATDYNNNPNIINGIFNTAQRLGIAENQTVDGGALLLAPKTAQRPIPHVLVDGADTIGVTGALGRVFINIGTHSEQWLKCHNPLLGLKPTHEFDIEKSLENSVFWQATIDQMDNLAKYLVRAGQPIPLEKVPGGQAYLTEPQETVDRGKIIFAENCFACHSSKQPDGYPKDFVNFREWSKDPTFLDWARTEVMKPDFLENNYLSTDRRIPITLVKTNAARAIQDNAKAGHVWGQFSSVDWKNTPSVGTIDVQNPFDGSPMKHEMRGGGPGFYRVPSLIAIWSSAPFLHNNALGDYNHDPSVAGRMAAFDDAIRKMCWPEKRAGLATVATATERCWFRIPSQFIPVLVKGIAGDSIVPFLRHWWLIPLLLILPAILLFRLIRKKAKPKTWKRRLGLTATTLLALLALLLIPILRLAGGHSGDLKLGPIPKGFPLNLMVNIDPEITSPLDTAAAMLKLNACFAEIESRQLDDEAALKLIAEKAGPALLAINKAPDFVRDRGHTFPAHLSDQDKEALIAFLKRL